MQAGEVRGNTLPLPPTTSSENFQEALTAATDSTAWPAALSRAPNPTSVADPGKVTQQGGGKGRKTLKAVSTWLSKSGLPEKLEKLFGRQVQYTPGQVKRAIDDLSGAAALEGNVVAPEEDVLALEDDVLALEEDVLALEEDVLAPGEDLSAVEEDVLALGGDVLALEGDVLVLEDVAQAHALTVSIVGMPSTVASSVDAALRQAFDIPDDVPSAVAHVVVLSDADFLDVAAEANVEDAPSLNAFIVWNSDGTVRRIAVREGAENPETLAHELLHAYMALEFASTAESFLVDPEQPYSNLCEGFVDFLVWLFMGDTWEAPPAQGAHIASQIYEVMDADVFYRACFLGDESAVDAVRQAAKSFTELTVVAEKFPIIQAQVQGVGGASPPDPAAIAIAQTRGVVGFVRGAFANPWGQKVALYGTMLALTIPPALAIDPRILAVGNGLGFLLRGVGTAAPLIFPRINAKLVGAWQAMTFVLNGASHDRAASGFNPAHWNAPGHPYNDGYALTDELGGVGQLSTAATGQAYPAAKLEQYGSLIPLNAANVFLTLNYSIPTGPGALAPTVLFGGGAAYLLAKTAALDILGKFANSSKVPQRIRNSAAAWRAKIEGFKEHKIPQWMIALGLIGFGADYLIQNALPKLNAQHVNVTSPQQVLTAVLVNLLGLGASVGLPAVLHKLRLPKGALAYPDAEAAGTPAGLFKKGDSVSLTGNTVIDVEHHLWIEVTGTELGGGTLTAWVDARDLPRPHISVTDPNGAPLHIESVSSGREAALPTGTPLTLTGKYQKDRSGDVWVEVRVKVRQKTVTGWIDVGRMGPATPPPAGGVINAPPPP
jgi:hypothetical protein